MSSLLVWALCLLFAADQSGVVGGVVGGLPQEQPRDPRAAARVATGAGSISGRVTAADSGAPLRRAVVNLNGPPGARATYTDHEGRYQFNNLPPGNYNVFVNPGEHRAGYQALAYGSPVSSTAAQRPKPVQLGDGEKIQNIDVALPRTGVITGRVTDMDGEPAARVQIGAWILRPGSEPAQVGGTMTDDLGHYRLFGLMPGEYLVMANPSGGGGGGPAEIEGEPTGFAPTYAPGTPSRGDAMRLRVARGGQASADIRLSETRVYSISGTVVNSKGEPSRTTSVMLSRADGFGGGFGASTMTPGIFTIRNVPPGQYQLIARYMPSREAGVPVQGPDLGQEYASVQVDVDASNVDGVVLVTRPGAVVTGQVVLDEPLPQGRRVNLFAQTTERRPFMGTPAIELKDTTFTMRNVFGPIVLRGSIGGGPNWGLKAVLLRGKDITDEPTAFTDGDSGHLQIVFTATASSIEGTVTDQTGKPTDEAAIILFGEDPKTWLPRSSYFRTMRAIKDGRFTLTGLREGRYLAVAVPLDISMSLTQPSAELFEALSKVATAVALNPGEKRTVDLVLVKFQER